MQITPPPPLGVSPCLSSSYANGDGLRPRPVAAERYSACASHSDSNARFSALARSETAAWRPSLADDQAPILEWRSRRIGRCGFPEHTAQVLGGWLGTTRVQCGPTGSAAEYARSEGNLACGGRDRPSLDYFGVTWGRSTPPLTLLQQAVSRRTPPPPRLYHAWRPLFRSRRVRAQPGGGTAMCLIRYGLLAVSLLASAALAEPPPRSLDVYGTAAADRKSETLLPARAAHRVTVRVPPLHWAAIEGDTAEVKRLIAAGADLTATETLWGGERALHWAAHGGSGAVRALIAAGAALEARDDDGETALREALRPDDSSYLALTALLVAGADPIARDTDRWTALHEAVLNEHVGGAGAVGLLRVFGADPNATTMGGGTPLHYAALRPWDYFWGHLLVDPSRDPHQRAADVNAKDSLGRTPLHYVVGTAASAKDRSVMSWLMDHGADVNAVDNYGSTPLDWAEFGGLEELAGVLRGAGGVNRRRPPDPTP